VDPFAETLDGPLAILSQILQRQQQTRKL